MDRQYFQMIKKGFESVNNSFRKFAKKLSIDIPEKKIDPVDAPTPEHQAFQLIKNGFEAIADTVDKINIRQPEDGKPGSTPTDDQLLALIKPLIPKLRQPEDGKPGKTPTKEEILALIRPLIPKVKDGETPSDERLLALIKPLIPEAPKVDTKGIIERASEEAIKYIVKKLSKFGKEFRDGLELLVGDDRLDKSAIRGIKELEDKIDNIKPVTYVYGKGGSAVEVEDEKFKLNASDPTAGYFEEKVLAGTGIDITNGVISSTQSSGGGFKANLYFRTDDSDVAGYKRIAYDFEVAETELTGSLTNTEVLFRTYLFDDPIETTIIDAGPWVANYRVKVDKAMGVTQLKFEAFLRHADTTETTLFSAYSNEINNLTYETLRQTSNQPSFACVATDRLGVRIYAKTTSMAAVTIDTIVGDGNASYFSTPLSLRHSLLRDKNEEPEYQHIDATDRENLDSLFSFETVSKNLSAYPHQSHDVGGLIDTIVYTTPGGTITKTYEYTGDDITSITLSGATPNGIALVKTYVWSGDEFEVTYS